MSVPVASFFEALDKPDYHLAMSLIEKNKQIRGALNKPELMLAKVQDEASKAPSFVQMCYFDKNLKRYRGPFKADGSPVDMGSALYFRSGPLPLFRAINSGNETLVQYLLDSNFTKVLQGDKADPNCLNPQDLSDCLLKSNFGFSQDDATEQAISSIRIGMIMALMRAGYDPKRKQEYEDTLACMKVKRKESLYTILEWQSASNKTAANLMRTITNYSGFLEHLPEPSILTAANAVIDTKTSADSTTPAKPSPTAKSLSAIAQFSELQMKGFLAGFTMEDVKSSWFSKAHVDACFEYRLQPEGLRGLAETQVRLFIIPTLCTTHMTGDDEALKKKALELTQSAVHDAKVAADGANQKLIETFYTALDKPDLKIVKELIKKNPQVKRALNNPGILLSNRSDIHKRSYFDKNLKQYTGPLDSDGNLIGERMGINFLASGPFPLLRTIISGNYVLVGYLLKVGAKLELINPFDLCFCLLYWPYDSTENVSNLLQNRLHMLGVFLHAGFNPKSKYGDQEKSLYEILRERKDEAATTWISTIDSMMDKLKPQAIQPKPMVTAATNAAAAPPILSRFATSSTTTNANNGSVLVQTRPVATTQPYVFNRIKSI